MYNLKKLQEEKSNAFEETMQSVLSLEMNCGTKGKKSASASVMSLALQEVNIK